MNIVRNKGWKMWFARTVCTLTAVIGVVGSVAACSSSGNAHDGELSVVASTDVWGDVAAQITQGVDGIAITSIITDPAADPHSYESDARTALAVKRASLIIENGGGYDDFMSTLRSSTGTDAPVVNAVTISGRTAPAGGDLNEHVWYDFPTVIKVADQIASSLATRDSAHAATFRANATSFDTSVRALEATEARIKAAHAGAGVAITEPVPLYMLAACGLVNKTPAEFSEAIENGTDVPVSVLRDTEQLFDGKQVKLLAYNEQTTGAETEDVLSAARTNDIRVVPVTETLPAGDTYLSWMTKNLAAVARALG